VETANCRTYSQKGDKTDCSNYRGISLLSTSYNIVSSIILPRLIPYEDEIIENHQCAFRRSRSKNDQIFYIRHILEKKWEYNNTSAIYRFQESLWLFRSEVLYNILSEFVTRRKLVQIIKTCLN
jgi:hypothetical protein